ncbi:aldehyde dehydrogenase (NAD+) [Sediminihabitans luteus]|uniref:aldehyde dehydrogenase (NAD(+)) n=1 Tax=Sediminihabitans luteus TaxID=1138585 RepID=A0A2M9CZJ3_9CELL|nr:aldehyde dehydrogenase family protein [Sediminihabitans luteus]PJJ77366.1 aldehyde dehydrogenase (NAD+) [Sediminihabitans luteus]GII98259.1 aldehyde dehydrogenase [Sediminihabitans luteus]
MSSYTAHYVDGRWREAESPDTFTVTDAAHGTVIGTVPAGTAHEVDLAVQAARAAFPAWAALDVAQRVGYLKLAAEELARRQNEIAALVSREVGMPYATSNVVQVGLPLMSLAATTELALEHRFEQQVYNSLVVSKPVGVVATITPWNYPLHQVVAKIAPALAVGCTVVAKPSEVAPLSAFVLAEVLDAVGLPAGVFNLVSGDGPTVGEAMVAHPGVDMVSFTGSTRAGRRIGEVAARTVKRVSLELGGKSPLVALDDADPLAVVTTSTSDCFLNSGQTCIALTRLVVPASRKAEYEAIARAAAEGVVVGDPFDPASDIGPLVSATQLDRVREYVQVGIDEGATLLAGGPDPVEGVDAQGYYVRPTVFTDTTPDMRIVREEIFGPVLVIQTYETEDEAVALANDTEYGLNAGVWSADVDRAVAFARRLDSGQVQVNDGAFNIHAPFGGVKQSGNGRELGVAGIEDFLVTSSLQLP